MDKSTGIIILIAVLVNILVLVTAILKIGSWTGVVNTSIQFLAQEIKNVKETLSEHTKADDTNFKALTAKVGVIEVQIAARRREFRRVSD